MRARRITLLTWVTVVGILAALSPAGATSLPACPPGHRTSWTETLEPPRGSVQLGNFPITFVTWSGPNGSGIIGDGSPLNNRLITFTPGPAAAIRLCKVDPDAPPTTAPPTTAPPTTAPPTTAPPLPPPDPDAPLQRILDRYAATRSAGTSFSSYEVEDCRDDLTAPPVDPTQRAEPGTVLLCAITTVPPADAGDLLLVVLPGGLAASYAASDGGPSLPFTAPPGMLCREFLRDPYFDGRRTGADAYRLVLAYWFREGAPDRMDVDRNRIPCELLFAPEVVASVWFGDV